MNPDRELLRRISAVAAALWFVCGMVLPADGMTARRTVTWTCDAAGVTVILESSLGRDDFFRSTTVTTVGSTGVQGQSVSYTYNNRSLVTSASLAFTDGISGPTVTVNRGYDGSGAVNHEQTLINGAVASEFTQGWDGAGRRSSLNFLPAIEGSGAGTAFGYGYRADGLLSQVSVAGQNYTFGYDTAGLLTSRVNPWRTMTVGGQAYVDCCRFFREETIAIAASLASLLPICADGSMFSP